MKLNTENNIIPITRINENLLVVARPSMVHIIDINRQEIIKSFDIYVRGNLAKNITCLSSFEDKYLIVCSYDEKKN